jgi:hypothetical protein
MAMTGEAMVAGVRPLRTIGTTERKETEMPKVIVTEWMSLDEVVHAPGAADKDTSGGFEHGRRPLRDR